MADLWNPAFPYRKIDASFSGILNLLIQKEFEFFKERRKFGFPEKPGVFVRFSRIFRLNLQCQIRCLA